MRQTSPAPGQSFPIKAALFVLTALLALITIFPLDGCGYWGFYRHVILPLSRPILAALSVFFFLANWNSFLWPLTIVQNEKLWMVQVGIASFQTQYAGAWNYIMAAATVAVIPTMAIFFVFQRQLVESIKTSGFK